MSNRQWREGYDEGLHQVHLELDPEVEALRDRVRELEAENESLGVTQDQHRAANVRLRASVMESDGRWKDLSARYDALFAKLRTARGALERLECQCSYVSKRSGCHAWAQQLLEQIRAALATIDSGAVPECPDCKTVREWLAGERVAVQNYDRKHDSMAVSVTEDILDRLEEATNA